MPRESGTLGLLRAADKPHAALHSGTCASLSTFARDTAMQMLAMAMLLWPVERWLWDFPVAPVGLALGFVIGLGNALRWKLGAR